MSLRTPFIVDELVYTIVLSFSKGDTRHMLLVGLFVTRSGVFDFSTLS